MAATIDHPVIGKVQGKQGDGIVQYLGIKYGVLADRFAEAKFPDYTTKGTVDGTHLAPAVLSPPDAVDMEQGLIQQTLPFTYRKVSDIDGLALSISVPAGTTSSSKLPVFAFIHGGGFGLGSTTWPQYDFGNLVRLSIARGAPIIGIGINYRLGIPGFLNSETLVKAGYKPNRGLRDQRLALQWIQQYISGFGGDPENVTVGGESAGAVSIAYHFQSVEPLFKRAVAMSGSDILWKASAPADDVYNTACKILGLDDKPPEEQVKTLTTMDGLEMLSKTGMAVRPDTVIDNDLIKVAPTFSSLLDGTHRLPAHNWLESLMIGDCAFDGNIMSLYIGSRKSNIASTFSTSIHSSLPTTSATKLLSTYNITPSTEDGEAFLSVLRFINDISFYAPTTAYATSFAAKSKVYTYRFNIPNPWPGPWQGEATHILDVAYLFQNFTDNIPREQGKKVAKELGERVLAYVAGETPWEQWTLESKVAYVFQNEGGKIVGDTPAETGRRREFGALAEVVGLDELDRALAAFLKG